MHNPLRRPCTFRGGIFRHGVPLNGTRYYFDYQGKAYAKEDIAKLPIKKFVIGECAREMESIADRFTNGCCNISEATFGLSKVTGINVPLLSVNNKGLIKMFSSMIHTYQCKKRLIKQGEYVDVEYDPLAFDKIYPIPDLSQGDMQKDYIEWPRPLITKEKKKELLKGLSLIG